MAVPAAAGGPGHRLLAVRVDQALKGDGRLRKRHRKLGAEQLDRRVDRGDVDQDARDQLPFAVSLDISPQRPLVAGATGEIAKRPRLDPLCGQALEVGDVDRLTGTHGGQRIRETRRMVPCVTKHGSESERIGDRS